MDNQTHVTPRNPGQVLRQRWISAFSRTQTQRLKSLLEDVDTGVAFHPLRPAEVGLVMVRARAGGTGQKFNMGEMTVTRCAVRSANGPVGHGYVAGRNSRHAEIAARLDAIFQDMPAEHVRPIVDALESDVSERQRARQQKSAPTRVEFFTMVRGDD